MHELVQTDILRPSMWFEYFLFYFKVSGDAFRRPLTLSVCSSWKAASDSLSVCVFVYARVLCILDYYCISECL